MYCFDTSAFIQGFRLYPSEVLPDLWDEKIDSVIRSGGLVSPDEVLRELERRDDAVHASAKARSGLFVPIDDEMQFAVTEILAAFPKLMQENKNRNAADPWVIALAKTRSLTVVTYERPVRVERDPRIPEGLRALSDRVPHLAHGADAARELGVPVAVTASRLPGFGLARHAAWRWWGQTSKIYLPRIEVRRLARRVRAKLSALRTRVKAGGRAPLPATRREFFRRGFFPSPSCASLPTA
jgi:Domain of unknown function (DUF4411)